RLAAPGLADDAQCLAGTQIERHPVDGANHAIGGKEMGLEIAHLKQRTHMRLASLGSRRSRRPSRSMLTASTVTARNAPGMKMVRGAAWKKVRPWRMRWPQRGTSGGPRARRNASPASISIAEAHT